MATNPEQFNMIDRLIDNHRTMNLMSGDTYVEMTADESADETRGVIIELHQSSRYLDTPMSDEAVGLVSLGIPAIHSDGWMLRRFIPNSPEVYARVRMAEINPIMVPGKAYRSFHTSSGEPRWIIQINDGAVEALTDTGESNPYSEPVELTSENFSGEEPTYSWVEVHWTGLSAGHPGHVVAEPASHAFHRDNALLPSHGVKLILVEGDTYTRPTNDTTVPVVAIVGSTAEDLVGQFIHRSHISTLGMYAGYECRMAEPSPIMVVGKKYRFYSIHTGNPLWLAEYIDTGHIRYSRFADATELELGTYYHADVGRFSQDIRNYVWFELDEVGAEATTETVSATDTGTFIPDMARELGEKDSGGNLVINPALIEGESYYYRFVNGDPNFFLGTYDPMHGFIRAMHYNRGFLESMYIDALGEPETSTWVKAVPVAVLTGSTENDDQRLSDLDVQLSKEDYYRDSLWMATHKLAEENDWCSNYDDIMSAWPMEMPARNITNSDLHPGTYEEWLPTRGENDRAEEPKQWDVTVIANVDVRYVGVPSSVAEEIQECEDNYIDGFVASEANFTGADLTLGSLFIGDFTASQMTFEEGEQFENSDVNDYVMTAIQERINNSALYHDDTNYYEVVGIEERE